jgi:hypothetical protein
VDILKNPTSGGSFGNNMKNKIRDMGIKAEIGKWYTRCCYLDLEQIKNNEELVEVLKDLLEYEDALIVGIWDTELEALKEIRTWFSDKQSLGEIDDLISLCRDT